MIDTSRTREQMLADIGARELDAEHPASDLAALARATTVVEVEGADAPTLLARLYPALTARYPTVPHDRLWRDLLDPIKKSVGNAWKHGNRKDPAKRVRVRFVGTPAGLFAEVRDEGPGFDFADVLARLESEQKYFNHHGSGFKHFHRARSVMTYADGGRTFLLRFRLDDTLDAAEDAGAGGLDADAMAAALAARIPALRAGRGEIVSCGRIPDDDVPAVFAAAYLVEIATGGGRRKVVLSARAVAPRNARAERRVAKALRAGMFGRGAPLRVAVPITALRDLGLVLYPLAARRDLRDHVHDGDLASAVEAVERVGRGLRLLHRTKLDVPRTTRSREIDRAARAVAVVLSTLGRKSPERAARAREAFDATAAALRALDAWPSATIHGAFAWSHVLVGGARLHLVGLDGCRASHPAIDVGGFLLDLRRILALRAKADPRLYPAALEAFERVYFAGGAPEWRAHLDRFTAFAMPSRLERLLRRAEKKWEAKVDGLLDEWDRLLGRPAAAP